MDQSNLESQPRHRDDAVLQAVRELRADFRQMREMDEEDHRAMMKTINGIGDKVNQHERWWSITFLVGKFVSWLLGLGGAIGAWFGLKG